LKDDGKQEGFILTVTKAAGKDICGRVGPVGILADLQAEIADIVLDEPGSEVGENVLVAGGGLLPFSHLVKQGWREVKLVVIERAKAPVDDLLPILVFGDTDEREGVEPGGGVVVVVIVFQWWVGPAVDEGISVVLFFGGGRVVGGNNMEWPVRAADDRVEIVADGRRSGEIVLSGKFLPEYGVETDNGVSYFDPVSDADIGEGDESAPEAIVFKISGIGLFLYNLDPGGLELVEGGAVTQDANTVEDDFLELRRKGNGNFRLALNARCVYNLFNEVSVISTAKEVDLLVP